MNISLENALVAIFLILPGFFASSVQRTALYTLRGALGTEDGGVATWAAVSVLRSFALNALVFIGCLLVLIDFGAGETLAQVQAKLNDRPVSFYMWYLATLYLLAFLLGITSAVANTYELHRRFHLKGWTSISPYPNVWNAAIDSFFKGRRAGQPRREVPWVQVMVSDSRTITGRLERGNVSIQQDKAFEVFLSQTYETIDGAIVRPKTHAGFSHLGTYLRVTENMPVHLFSGPQSWAPDALVGALPVARMTAGSFSIVDNVVLCKGPPGGSRHPEVYVVAGADGLARCPYCNSLFAMGRL